MRTILPLLHLGHCLHENKHSYFLTQQMTTNRYTMWRRTVKCRQKKQNCYSMREAPVFRWFMLPCQILQLLLKMNLNLPNLVPHLGNVASVRTQNHRTAPFDGAHQQRERKGVNPTDRGGSRKKKTAILCSYRKKVLWSESFSDSKTTTKVKITTHANSVSVTAQLPKLMCQSCIKRNLYIFVTFPFASDNSNKLSFWKKIKKKFWENRDSHSIQNRCSPEVKGSNVTQ